MRFEILIAQADSAIFDPSGFEHLAPPLQVAIFLGAMSFLAAALISLTAFTRIIIVLSFVRRALSTNEIPPNQVILGLSLFLTIFVMAPTFTVIHQDGIQPYLLAQEQEVPDKDILSVVEIAAREMRKFMLANTRKSDLALFVELSKTSTSITLEEIPMKVLIPAFIISELKTAFIMGFCLYIPFLLIDLVISTVLMSLGMMMMPPVVVSTPCKLLLFVRVDGWHLISSALVVSFGG